MKLNPSKGKVMEMRHSERGLRYEFNLVSNKHESVCAMDLEVNTVPELLSEHHIKKIVEETNYLPSSINTAF